jgi:hypothetical protein
MGHDYFAMIAANVAHEVDASSSSHCLPLYISSEFNMTSSQKALIEGGWGLTRPNDMERVCSRPLSLTNLLQTIT